MTFTYLLRGIDLPSIFNSAGVELSHNRRRYPECYSHRVLPDQSGLQSDSRRDLVGHYGWRFYEYKILISRATERRHRKPIQFLEFWRGVLSVLGGGAALIGVLVAIIRLR